MESDEPSGTLLRLAGRREVAFYLYDGRACVADFRDGRGELWSAGCWLALNGRALRRAPAPPEVIGGEIGARIRRLHGGKG